MKKTIGATLLLFVLLLSPFEEKVILNDTSIITIIDQMPMEASYAEAVKGFESAFGMRMLPLNDSPDYAIHYLDRDGLTLFGYPVTIATYQNAVWDHCLVFFAEEHDKARFMAGGRGTFSAQPVDERFAREDAVKSSLQVIEEIYSRFGSSFGPLDGGGVMAYRDDGREMKERFFSLPRTADGAMDMAEIERLFQACSYGTCSIVLETENSWQLHFDFCVSDGVVEITAACLKARESYLEGLGYEGFAGPDGESAAL